MNQRFQNAEINRVNEQYADNELYKAICQIGDQFEAELAEFGLCSEECFVETLALLTVISEKGQDVLPELDNIWLRMHNEYKRFDRQVGDEDIRKTVGIVFGFAILALDTSSHHFYKFKLTQQLSQTIVDHKFKGWVGTLHRIFSVPLPDGWFDAFINEETEEESRTERRKLGAKVTKFTDFIINKAETEEVTGIIRKNINSDSPQQTAFVIIGGIEAGRISRNVSSPSIERTFGVNEKSIKPYFTRYKRGGFYSEEELKPYKDLFCKE